MTSNRRIVFLALIAAGILWGTTVPLSKLALGWMAPGWLAVARFALAAAVLMVASRSRLRGAASPAILISGGIGYGGSVLLQNLGIERTSVTHAALLIGATPVLIAIMAAALRHSVARPLAWAGFALSLAGVGFIASGQGSGSTLGGDGLVMAAQLVSAGFTVSQARLLRGRDPVAVTGLQLMAAAVMVLPIALATEHHAAGPVSVPALLATLGLVLAGTVGPTALFAFGQSRVAADVAGAFLNIEPLVGTLLGMALFAEPLGPVQVGGGAAIVTGIALSSFQVVRGERLRSRTRPAAVHAAVVQAAVVPAVLPAAVVGAALVPAAPATQSARTALPGRIALPAVRRPAGIRPGDSAGGAIRPQSAGRAARNSARQLSHARTWSGKARRQPSSREAAGRPGAKPGPETARPRTGRRGTGRPRLAGLRLRRITSGRTGRSGRDERWSGGPLHSRREPQVPR